MKPAPLPSFYVVHTIKADECVYVSDNGNVFATDSCLADIPHSIKTCCDDAVEGDILTLADNGNLRKMTPDEVSGKLFGEAL